MQTKLELFSPEIDSALENKELPSCKNCHFRVNRKSTTSAQTDGRIVIHNLDSLKYDGCKKSKSITFLTCILTKIIGIANKF